MKQRSLVCLLLGWALWGNTARAEEITVAVAANFVGTLETLKVEFEKSSGHTLVISPGSTGQLYAQVKAGAPFDVFMSADAERTLALEKEGLSVKSTRFAYARGKLALWSKRPGFVDDKGAVLKLATLGKVSLADPRTAPYGAAGQAALKSLKLWETLSSAEKIVLGTGGAQAYQFAASGSADCAFVAYSQVLAAPGQGSFWLVPERLYPPLEQEAVLLKSASKKSAARAFLGWLRRDKKARDIIVKAGYGLGHG